MKLISHHEAIDLLIMLHVPYMYIKEWQTEEVQSITLDIHIVVSAAKPDQKNSRDAMNATSF